MREVINKSELMGHLCILYIALSVALLLYGIHLSIIGYFFFILSFIYGFFMCLFEGILHVLFDDLKLYTK